MGADDRLRAQTSAFKQQKGAFVELSAKPLRLPTERHAIKAPRPVLTWYVTRQAVTSELTAL